MKPSICFVAPNAFPLLVGDPATPLVGGAELQQVLLARAMARRGYAVSMVCWDFGQSESTEIDRVRVIRACRPDEGVVGLRFVYPRMWSIFAALRRADAAVYYQRAAGVLTGIVAAFCQRTNRKSIFAAAGNPDLLRRTPRVRLARDRWIYEYGLKRVSKILVQNEEQRRLCLENFGRTSILIPNASLDAPQGSRSVGSEILWISTIRSLKRPEYFLDLALQFPERKFTMIGGPSGDEPRLYEAIRRRAAGIANLTFLGFVPFAKVAQHFARAALFVNTSESEGFPNTFLQAWSHGVPTVSFVDCGARMGGLQVGVQVVDFASLCCAVRSLMGDESARLALGERGSRYVKEHHSVDQAIDQLERVINDLMLSPQDNQYI